MSHTPTPWNAREYEIYDVETHLIAEFCGYLTDINEDAANAAFVVKAVNSHDVLVSALNSIAHTFMENSQGGLSTLPAGEYQRMAREALTRAGLL
jgi:hypothetical protein